MSTGLYSITTRVVGTVLTAAIYNADHQNHITNQNPSMTGAYSDNVAQMQATTDPYASLAESLASSLAGELERLRFMWKQAFNLTNWYRHDQGVYPRSYLAGFGLANNAGDATNDIDIAVGLCRDGSDAGDIRLTSALTKQLDAVWAVGNNAGMRASGAAIANTTYHLFAIKRPDTGVVDIAADTSVTGANVAANTNVAYTLLRRIGSIVRSGGAILGFVQDGDYFRWKAQATDVSAVNPGAAAVTRTLSVPVGINVQVLVNIDLYEPTSNLNMCCLSDLAANDEVPNGYNAQAGVESTGALARYAFWQGYIRTNTAAQIRSRLSFSAAGTLLVIGTLGWLDRRGRDA